MRRCLFDLLRDSWLRRARGYRNGDSGLHFEVSRIPKERRRFRVRVRDRNSWEGNEMKA
jgi:hypothetical protein